MILWFHDAACADVRAAGGKGASLAAMTAAGLPVPPGFVVAANVLVEAVDAERLCELARARRHEEAHALVAAAEPPLAAVGPAYESLGGGRVAVRSSACAEDGEAASYAGQQETFLGVEGSEAVAHAVVACWTSFFSERAMFYRQRKGSLDDVGMAVVVQRMVEPAKSGVLFSVDPVGRRRDRMLIEAVHGLGEQVVSGEVTPDHYLVDRRGAVKHERLVHGGVLTAEELERLASFGRLLEKHFGGPQDVEWAIAGGEIHLLQSRPVTTL